MEQKRPLTEKEREEARKKRADAFWNIFLFTKNGKLKSTRIIYSFSMSVLFLALYGICFLFLPGVIERPLSPYLPVWLLNVIESLVPAAIGTGLCLLTFFAVKTKVLVPSAYIWLILYAVVAFLFVAIGLDAESRTLFFRVYAMIVPLPLILGTVLSYRLFRKYFNDASLALPKEKRAWERK